ncbi:MAG: hypothetical protein IIC74_10090 [Bacteroidetes bacterium]|nr:hypothetical protein [Bacteroidota bacterium]
MKTKYIKFISAVVILFLVITSCNNELQDSNVIESVQSKEAKKIESKYNLLDYTPNVYHNFFRNTDNSIGFSSLKPNSLKPHSIVKRTKFSENSKQMRFSINNETVNGLSMSKSLPLNKVNNIYGKTIRFRVNNRVDGFSINGEDTGTEIEMYVPELVEITNPAVTNLEERSPLCDSNNFVLEWNADPNNEEGLIVIAEYFGGNAIPEHSQDIRILNTDFIENDNGRTTLNTSLFQDIPNLSFVDIILLRGNVTIEEIEGELYKFFAESHVRLPIILVKDVNTIVKQD